MPIQAPQWTEFLSCPVCCNEFAANLRPPISLGCGHTICRTCLATLHRKQCPFDQTIISTDLDNLPVNNALLQLVSTSNTAGSSPGSGNGTSNTSSGSSTGGTGTPGGSAIDPDLSSPSVQNLSPEDLQCYKTARGCIEELALYLKPYPNGNAGGLLSRPMQRKLVTLVNCQLIEDEGRARSLRAARSLGERTVTELILQHQNPQQLSTNLWAAVRARGCQFLGPAMQEEVLKLVLLALEDGSALSRKVLVMFVVQRLEPHFPQASKTSIGHVVQLLYRASCFKVSKREGDSSLMQLKEEFRTYEALRREHDAQIVQIATEAGLRIAPDQWSSLLYGDTAHKSHMQSIIDKLQTPQSFVQSVQELIIALQRTGDPANLSGLRVHLKHLASIDSNAENHVPTWRECSTALEAVKRVVIGLVDFVQHHGNRKLQEPGHLAHNSKYKISLCRDLNLRGTCPRGPNCTFAHSEEELEKYRTKLRKNNIRTPNGKDHGEYIGDLGMPSTSHGYHSSGEEASPMRYPKSTPPMRYLDKSPMSSHSHASGSSNSNSSHNSHLAPIPPHQHPPYSNVPPPPTPLQHGANGRNFNFNPNYPNGAAGNLAYGNRPPPPPMPPPPVHNSGPLRGNFIRPPNGNFLGHPPPPPPPMQHNPTNGPPMNMLHGGNHPTYPANPPPPMEQMHQQLMNGPPPSFVGNQAYSDYQEKMDQRRQLNPWENQPPPTLPNPNNAPSGAPGPPQHSAVPPVNLLGQQHAPKSGINPSYPSGMMGNKTYLPPPPPTMPPHTQHPAMPPLASQQLQHHHQQQQQQPLQQQHHNVPGSNAKYYPGNNPLHHKPRDYRDKHLVNPNNTRLHMPHTHSQPPHPVPSMQQQQPQPQQQQQQPQQTTFGNGNRNNLHAAISQVTQNLVSNGNVPSTGNNGALNNGYTGNTMPLSRSDTIELLKMLGASADLANPTGATKDMFVRSDSLLNDDDFPISESDFSNAIINKFGPISRMNNQFVKSRGDFPFASNLLEGDWLLSVQQLYNDAAGLGDLSSSNCSSASSSFYQQSQQHPASSQTSSNKSEPNNNTLELDLFQVDSKIADYTSALGGANQSNSTSQLLLHHQVEAQLLQQQQQQQQQQHHMSHAATAPQHMAAAVQLSGGHHAAGSLLSSHHQQQQHTPHSHHTSAQAHHHQQQQQQQQQHQHQQQHLFVQQQQHPMHQQHSMQSHKLPSNLVEAMRLSELMGNGGSGELKISSFKELKDLKTQQTMTGLSPVSGGLTASTSSSSSVAMPPLWNNLLDLSGLKPTSDANDLVGVHGSNSTGVSVGGANNSNNTILSNSTASTSISNLNSNSSNNNEDSYEAGIADDMQKLALRLESELELDKNGV